MNDNTARSARQLTGPLLPRPNPGYDNRMLDVIDDDDDDEDDVVDDDEDDVSDQPNGEPAGRDASPRATAGDPHGRDEVAAKPNSEKDEAVEHHRAGGEAAPFGNTCAPSNQWCAPAHLPAALLPGGAAETALKAAAQNEGIEQGLLNRLGKGLESIRQHSSLNSPPATESPAAMRKSYAEVLRVDAIHDDPRQSHMTDVADLVLRYCLAVHAGLELPEDFTQDAIGEYAIKPSAYLAALGNLVPSNLRSRAEELRFKWEINSTSAGDWPVFMEHLTILRRRPQQGLATGLQSLDDATGGMRGVIVLAGLTGSGKTSLSLNIGAGVLRRNKNAGVIVFNLESDRDTYYCKLLSMESGVDYRTLLRGDWPEAVQQAVSSADSRLRAEILPRLRVVDRLGDTKRGALTHAAIAGAVDDFIAETGAARVLIIIDSVHELEIEHPVIGESWDRTEQRRWLTDLELDDARMGLLLRIQRQTPTPMLGGVPVLALSRVRKTDPGRRLTIADVPGKADVVFDADSVLLLEPAQQAPADADVTPTILNVAKVGDGGRRGDIYLDFHHLISTFRVRSHDKRSSADPSTKETSGSQGRKGKRFAGK